MPLAANQIPEFGDRDEETIRREVLSHSRPAVLRGKS
jgi:hypothetical protein